MNGPRMVDNFTQAWVVVGGEPGNLQYWGGRNVADFSYAHEYALRFARQQDAEQMMAVFFPSPPTFLRVEEHMWIKNGPFEIHVNDSPPVFTPYETYLTDTDSKEPK